MEIEPIEPECYYHIYSRGINRQQIFIKEDHYYKFLMLCNKYISQVADVLAFCLLPNHFHFLLYIHNDPAGVYPSQRGERPLGNLFNSYAQWFNKRTGRTGGLFQSPFKRKKIEDPYYLKRVVYYIHRNPVHHNITDSPAKYLYSSYLYILSDMPSMINRDKVMEWFEGLEDFRDYHKELFEFDYDELQEEV